MMDHLAPLVVATLRDRKGVTAAEYAVLAVGIVVVVAAAAVTFGSALSTRFSTIFAGV